jgi:hypothetical protein
VLNLVSFFVVVIVQHLVFKQKGIFYQQSCVGRVKKQFLKGTSLKKLAGTSRNLMCDNFKHFPWIKEVVSPQIARKYIKLILMYLRRLERQF